MCPAHSALSVKPGIIKKRVCPRPVHKRFKMDVVACAPSCGAHKPYRFPLGHVVAHVYIAAAHVAVQGTVAAPVINDHIDAVAVCIKGGGDHRAVCGGKDRGSVRRRNVNARVVVGYACGGVGPVSEIGCDVLADRGRPDIHAFLNNRNIAGTTAALPGSRKQGGKIFIIRAA